MDPKELRARSARIWELERAQHGVITRAQLLELGLGGDGIRHRLRRGRLHRLTPGVYAVGRPEVSSRGRWMAAVLASGPYALLSHRAAGELLKILKPRRASMVEVVVPARVNRQRAGIRAYRRADSVADRLGEPAGPSGDPGPLHWRRVEGIPVTGPATTLIDLATYLPDGQLEAAVNEADHRGLADPEALRSSVEAVPRRPGGHRLAALLDAAAHSLTTTALERLFLPIARDAGLPLPETQKHLKGHRVDFFWGSLGLVVETDSLRYHRTAFKQAKDKRRDNAHAGSGLTTLRFTHGQIRYEPDYVRRELRAVMRRLEGGTRRKSGPMDPKNLRAGG